MPHTAGRSTVRNPRSRSASMARALRCKGTVTSALAVTGRSGGVTPAVPFAAGVTVAGRRDRHRGHRA